VPQAVTPLRVTWTGAGESWEFRGGNFYGTAEIKNDQIHAGSAVTASVAEADATGSPAVGEFFVFLGAVTPYEGGVRIQVGVDFLEMPSDLRLLFTLLVTETL
jgi:hypothetical protein